MMQFAFEQLPTCDVDRAEIGRLGRGMVGVYIIWVGATGANKMMPERERERFELTTF